jgi:hypothetical protein
MPFLHELFFTVTLQQSLCFLPRCDLLGALATLLRPFFAPPPALAVFLGAFFFIVSLESFKRDI